MDKVLEKFETEIRRGIMQVAVVCLLDEEKYGYEIIKSLKEVGLNVEEGTLYPLLRRLEKDELLSSRWETSGPRPRKYYMVTEYGKEIRTKWLNSFNAIRAVIERLKENIQDNEKSGLYNV
ncbi:MULTISPECIES: PadR family transcriptional regulator [Methanobacterium]|jgi:DNA-binding PadR family transcriptional regulator|uniref:PadR family transcriptional regulator n=1 Tax=Methanobacterium bryantii TaxID=2161 RepID=A0A2A2H4N3_METBR|nr:MULTISPECIES: PadR family transcriptional regulator [Methanobacterium]OEC87221.1 PadR family transcriptional regulator [Methanobacterium sp. A39]PAV04243.1 PadR family transcriptional regulator [Methanobacterium bryantii]